MQRSNHERKGRCRGVNREPRQRNSSDNDLPLLRRRQALRVRCRKVDGQPDHGDTLVGQPPNAEPTHLDETGEGRGGTDQQPAGGRFDLGAIISDQAGEPQLPGVRRRDQVEGETRFAGAGRTANEDCARAHEHRRRVNG